MTIAETHPIMHTQRDWRIEFDAERYIAQAGGNLARLLARPSVRADWEAALADAYELIEPAAAWEAFPIRGFRHERLVLADGTKIGGGPVATVVAGATDLVVARDHDAHGVRPVAETPL